MIFKKLNNDSITSFFLFLCFFYIPASASLILYFRRQGCPSILPFYGGFIGNLHVLGLLSLAILTALSIVLRLVSHMFLFSFHSFISAILSSHFVWVLYALVSPANVVVGLMHVLYIFTFAFVLMCC